MLDMPTSMTAFEIWQLNSLRLAILQGDNFNMAQKMILVRTLSELLAF